MISISVASGSGTHFQLLGLTSLMEYLPEVFHVGYINESERNVHVWCSSMHYSSDPKFYGKLTLGLIAGCYVHSDELSARIFYKWLKFIILRPRIQKLHLVSCPDPRDYESSQPGMIQMPPGAQLIAHDSTLTIAAGHYLLYEYDPSIRKYIECWPELNSFIGGRRSRTGSQTCTPTPSKPKRDTATRTSVRIRDRCCLVTSQNAECRNRGGNFTGLEVAHIFPLKGAGNMDWMRGMSPTLQTKVSTRQLADRPRNAILLRADIHSLFDDYQWGIWIEQGATPRVFRFEYSGATALRNYNSTVTLTPANLDTHEPVNCDLLQHHFGIALLLHVKGFGMQPRAGATMI